MNASRDVVCNVSNAFWHPDRSLNLLANRLAAQRELANFNAATCPTSWQH
ncbi:MULTISPECIES: hypothetical protein [unclassified Coleofasciculus]|nr:MULTISPECIES: hypothetical protein [unclassified Coleofasciculus]MBE9127858.1 hypothetical protein [Coleofasciculus sp. LEGE 07081]MBE9149630.1 hypothetical protein [Coleofasciculus sp. LEGE 07092]